MNWASAELAAAPVPDDRHLDLACSLDGSAIGKRLSEWRELRDRFALGAEAIPGGARLRLRPDASEAARDLARQEAACCGFLDFDLVFDGGCPHLDITSAALDATGIIAELAGLNDGVVPLPEVHAVPQHIWDAGPATPLEQG